MLKLKKETLVLRQVLHLLIQVGAIYVRKSSFLKLRVRVKKIKLWGSG